MAAIALLCASAPLASQRIEVRAMDANGPLPGAMVVVEDAAGRTVTRLLANANGVGRIAVAVGSYRVRVLAIGHGPEISELLTVQAGGVATVRLVLVPRPLVIDEIVVSAEPACGRDVTGGAQLARLWDEARKNLEAAALSRTAGGAMYEVTTFERELTKAEIVVRENRTERRGRAVQPFVAPAGEIERYGYVRRAGDDRNYYAPDEPLLLSDHFLTSHCFSVVGGGLDPELVGLRFDPAPRRRLPDISGVLWLRRRTAELTLLEYSYTNVPLPAEARNVGGHLRFARLQAGASVIGDWVIRMPRIVTIVGRSRSRDSLVGYLEVGGITSLAGQPLDRDQSTIAGTVLDSIVGMGLRGVVVSISDGAYADTTNEAGAFRFVVPLQGYFLVTVSHPRIEQLQLAPLHRAVTLVRGQESMLQVRLPSATTSLNRMCPPDSAPADRSPAAANRSVILGQVLSASGGLLAGAEILATWNVVSVVGRVVGQRAFEMTITTGARGEFAVCAPLDRPVTLRALTAGADAVVLGTRRDPVSFATLTAPR